MIVFKKENGKLYIEADCKGKEEVTTEQAEIIVKLLIQKITNDTGKPAVYLAGYDLEEGDK